MKKPLRVNNHNVWHGSKFFQIYFSKNTSYNVK